MSNDECRMMSKDSRCAERGCQQLNKYNKYVSLSFAYFLIRRVKKSEKGWDGGGGGRR